MSRHSWLILAGGLFATAAVFESGITGHSERLLAEPTQPEVSVSPGASVAKFEVRLHNDASTPIRLVRALPDCSCTVARFDSRTVPSGASTQMTGEITLEKSDRTRRQVIAVHFQRKDEDRIRTLEVAVTVIRQPTP